MEYCCLQSKNSSDQELNQQNYFSYLNLRKSGISSELDVQCQAEVVTVRRTRRVLYRYILEKPTFEETGNKGEVLGDSSTIMKKSKSTKTSSPKRKNISLQPSKKSKKSSHISKSQKSKKKKSKDFSPQLMHEGDLNKCTNQLKEVLSEDCSLISTTKSSSKKRKNISLPPHEESKTSTLSSTSIESKKEQLKEFPPKLIVENMEVNKCTNLPRKELSQDVSLNPPNENSFNNCSQLEENLNSLQNRSQTLRRPATDPIQLNTNTKFDFSDSSKIPYKKRKIFHCFTNPSAELDNSPAKNPVSGGIFNKSSEETENNTFKKEEKSDHGHKTSEKSLNDLPLISLPTKDDANLKEATKESHYIYFLNQNVVIGDTVNYPCSHSTINEEQEIIEFVPEPQIIVEIYDSSETNLEVDDIPTNFLDQTCFNEHITDETSRLLENCTSSLAIPDLCKNPSRDQIDKEKHLLSDSARICEEVTSGSAIVENECNKGSLHIPNITTRTCEEDFSDSGSLGTSLQYLGRDHSLDRSYHEKCITSENTKIREELVPGCEDCSEARSKDDQNISRITESICKEPALDLTTVNDDFSVQSHVKQYKRSGSTKTCVYRDSSVSDCRNVENVMSRTTTISEQIFRDSTKLNILPSLNSNPKIESTDSPAIQKEDQKNLLNCNLIYSSPCFKSADGRNFTKGSEIVVGELEEKNDCTEYNFVSGPLELKFNDSPKITQTKSIKSKTQSMKTVSFEPIKDNTLKTQNKFEEFANEKKHKINYKQKTLDQSLQDSYEEKPNSSHILLTDVTKHGEKISLKLKNEMMEKATLEMKKHSDSSQIENTSRNDNTSDLEGMLASIKNMHQAEPSEENILKKNKTSPEQRVAVKEENMNSPDIVMKEGKMNVSRNNEEQLVPQAQKISEHSSISSMDELVKNCLIIRKKAQNMDVEENVENCELNMIECSKTNLSGRMKKQSMKEKETNQSQSILEMEINRKNPSPSIIRIEKSPSRDLQMGGDLTKNCSFEKFIMFQNVSSHVQKDAASSNDSVLESDFKMKNCKIEDKRQFDGGPKQIEVVHYKPLTTPTQYVHNNRKRKYCNFCNVGYTNDITLNKHMLCCKSNPINMKIDPMRIFYCKFCNFGITNEVYFKRHEEKCQKELIDKSTNLSSTPSIEEPSIKFKKKRSRIGRHKCKNCDYTSDNIGHMYIHRRIHDKIPLCVCDVCQKGFSRLDVLKKHMFRHLDVAQEVKEVKKEKVWNGRATKIKLEVIIRNKEFTIPKYECSECSYTTPMAESMDKHFSLIHLNSSGFRCNLCSFTTKVKSNLKQHLNWHLRERTYKCSHCPYETTNKTYIKKHENQVHLKAVSYKCDFCEFKSYRKENLKTHVNSKHLKAKKYYCDRCDYFSYVQSNLIGHVKTIHEGIKRKKKVD